MSIRLSWVVAALVVLDGCSCNRGDSLTNRFGDIVVVVPSQGTAAETLTREAHVSLEPVVMTEQGAGEIVLRNVGDTSVSLVHVSQRSGSTAFTLEEPSQREVAAQAEVFLGVTFAPPQAEDPTLPLVEHRAIFEIEATGTREGENLLTVEVVANAVGRDCLVPASLDFGVVPLNRSAPASLHLRNGTRLGQTPTLGSIGGTDPAAFTQTTPSPESVAAGQEVDVVFSFAPLAERAYEAEVTLRRSASCPEGTTVLRGVGSNEIIDWSPSTLDFGRMPLGESTARTLTFSNRSSTAFTLSAFTVDNPWFTITSLPGPTVALGGQSSVTIGLTCRPDAIGLRSGAVTVGVNTEPMRSIRVPLTCIGGGPKLRLTPSPRLEFGPVPFNSGASPLFSSTRRLTAQNVGTPPSSPTDTRNNLFFGKAQQPPFILISTSDGMTQPREFQVSLLGWDSAKGLPAIPGQNSADFDVRLTPISPGAKNATLTIYSNDSFSPATVIELSGSTISAGACELSVVPVALSFGDLPAGSKLTREVRLVNNSTNGPTCYVSGLDVAPGTDPAFRFTGPSNVVIAAGKTLPVQVEVTVPGTAEEGDSLNGYLRFSVNSQSTPTVLVPLGVRVAPCLVTTPRELDFGSVKMGCRSAGKSLTLYNACAGSIRIDSLEVVPTSAGFSVLSAPTIPSGGLALSSGVPVPLQLAFSPVDLVQKLGELVVRVTEAGRVKAVRVPLKGTGSMVSTVTETFIQPNATPADLLFVVDDSCSMEDEQSELAANFASFISYANQLGVPYQIGVTTTDFSPFGAQGRLLRSNSNPMLLTPNLTNVQQLFKGKVNVGTNGTGLEQPLECALAALSSPMIDTVNRGFLRADASLSIIVVSDAPDQSAEPVSYYLSRFKSLVPPDKEWLLTFSTIGPFTERPLPAGCSIDSDPDRGRYEPIITATHGVKADICTKDWAKDLEAIGKNALGPRATLYLTSPPDLTHPVTVTINNVPTTSFTVDPVTNAIVFSDRAVTPSGSTVKVTYDTTCY